MIIILLLLLLCSFSYGVRFIYPKQNSVILSPANSVSNPFLLDYKNYKGSIDSLFLRFERNNGAFSCINIKDYSRSGIVYPNLDGIPEGRQKLSITDSCTMKYTVFHSISISLYQQRSLYEIDPFYLPPDMKSFQFRMYRNLVFRLEARTGYPLGKILEFTVYSALDDSLITFYYKTFYGSDNIDSEYFLFEVDTDVPFFESIGGWFYVAVKWGSEDIFRLGPYFFDALYTERPLNFAAALPPTQLTNFSPLNKAIIAALLKDEAYDMLDRLLSMGSFEYMFPHMISVAIQFKITSFKYSKHFAELQHNRYLDFDLIDTLAFETSTNENISIHNILFYITQNPRFPWDHWTLRRIETCASFDLHYLLDCENCIAAALMNYKTGESSCLLNLNLIRGYLTSNPNHQFSSEQLRALQMPLKYIEEDLKRLEGSENNFWLRLIN